MSNINIRTDGQPTGYMLPPYVLCKICIAFASGKTEFSNRGPSFLILYPSPQNLNSCDTKVFTEPTVCPHISVKAFQD